MTAPAADVWRRPWHRAATSHRLAGTGPRGHVVGAGDAVTAAGFEVTVHGEWHAIVHHGDALTVPEVAVPTLLLPAHAPWSTTAELIDYLREVRAERALAVHDGLLNDTGLGLVAGLLGERGPGQPVPYTRLAPGESVAA
ncbi:hypothetical protein O2W18_17855 [Modestobacter sp. VKM Ac-2983]|uniref:hypothetical protein n=1 Tax=Modestobacter sp. VKM Ac-2983 TaxID=3004137 RepID=UPI0022AB9AA3|nr:hypothetical protein [Modestobacter sp. VKM Ac-2983]MCZ2806974.1 hypothetical protein [Modestobacter sp. VKM Ac-2983]